MDERDKIKAKRDFWWHELKRFQIHTKQKHFQNTKEIWQNAEKTGQKTEKSQDFEDQEFHEGAEKVEKGK